MITLQAILDGPLANNTQLINTNKIHLNYQQIYTIGEQIPHQFHSIQILYLSHNLIEKLNGIECFTAITHLSLSYNAICDIDELYHISNKEKLISLSIKGNFMVKHPNYITAILIKFPMYNNY